MENMSTFLNYGDNHKLINIDTKTCCFLCLTANITKNCGNCIKLDKLCRYLKINLSKLLTVEGEGDVEQIGRNFNRIKRESISVKLCSSCELIVERFKTVWGQLEKIQVELDYLTETIEKRITTAYQNHERVQNYSKEMTSNKNTLIQLAFADKFRMEIKNNCSIVQWNPRLKIKLAKIDGITSTNESSSIYSGDSLTQTLRSIKEEVTENLNYQEVDYPEDNYYDSPDPQLDNIMSPSPLTEKAEFNSELSLEEANATRICLNSPEVKSEIGSDFIKEKSKRKGRLASKKNIKKLSKINKKKLPPNKKSEYDKVAKVFRCIWCAEQFKTNWQALKHFNRKHVARKCQLCKTEFNSFKELCSHQNQCKKGKLAETKSVSLCPKGKVVMTSFCNETGVYKCTICKEVFSQSRNGIDHYRIVHLKMIFKCDVCNIATFKHSSNLRTHKKTCQKLRSRDFSCETCGKSYFTKAHLTEHVKIIHLGGRCYQCDLCDEKYKYSSHLTRHKNLVHFNMTFNCECGKRCQDKWKLKAHLKKCAKINKN